MMKALFALSDSTSFPVLWVSEPNACRCAILPYTLDFYITRALGLDIFIFYKNNYIYICFLMYLYSLKI